jgi:hypothetical protein
VFPSSSPKERSVPPQFPNVLIYAESIGKSPTNESPAAFPGTIVALTVLPDEALFRFVIYEAVVASPVEIFAERADINANGVLTRNENNHFV